MIVRPVTEDDWPLIERLFGAKGACGGCWCAYWHAPPGEAAWAALKGEPNRQMLRDRIASGRCPSVVALDGDTPVGWCRIGPTHSFERLQRSRKLWRDEMADWAVVCFYVPSARRKQGISRHLLDAAVSLAFASGARSIEGYPGIPAGDTMPAAFAWTGVPAIFEACGFKPVAHDAGARRIYRIERSVISRH